VIYVGIPKEICMIIARSIITILTLFVVTKILGKKQISQLTLYDYIIGITIGSIAADSIISLDEKIINGVVALVTFGVLGYILSYLAIKSTTANDVLNGKPLVLMSKGEFNFGNLEKSKISISKFIEEARLKGYYDINVLNYAILETNGQISFLPKEQYQNCNTADFKRDVKTKVSKQTVCNPLIIDGEVDMDLLDEFGKDINWLKKEMKELKVSDIEDVALATVNEEQQIRVYKKY